MSSGNIPSAHLVDLVRLLHVSHDPSRAQTAIWRDLSAPLPHIDSKYFYDDRGSQLFEDITALPEYYQTRTEEALLESIADDIIDLTRPAELVELGSGAGRKIRMLLEAGQRQHVLESCALLDVNESFLSASAERLATDYPGLAVRGVVGDFTHDLDAVEGSGRRLFLFFAGTIGNLHPRRLPGFLESVRSVLGHDDGFLVGLDLVKDRRRLEAAYNDSAGVTAEFNRNILRVLNRRFGTDFELDAFDHVAFYDTDQQWIEMRLRARRATAVTIDSRLEPLRFQPGDEIRTEISRKFTKTSVVEALQGTGLRLGEWWTDPEELFALALLRPR